MPSVFFGAGCCERNRRGDFADPVNGVMRRLISATAGSRPPKRRAGDKVATSIADVAQLVEHHLAKVRVAGSNPVIRSSEAPCQPGFRARLTAFRRDHGFA